MEQRFLRIMEKEIDLEQSPVIARGPQDDAALERDWEHQNGVWSVTDGWICGKHIGNSGGILYSKKHYPGNVLLEFEGRTVLPCQNDLNFTWCAAGWDMAHDDAGESYIAGSPAGGTGKRASNATPPASRALPLPFSPLKGGAFTLSRPAALTATAFFLWTARSCSRCSTPTPLRSTAKWGWAPTPARSRCGTSVSGR